MLKIRANLLMYLFSFDCAVVGVANRRRQELKAAVGSVGPSASIVDSFVRRRTSFGAREETTVALRKNRLKAQ
jgi:hypothetical protein